MKYKQLIIRKIKESFDQKFLFTPTNESFLSVYINTCSEFLSGNKLSKNTVAVVAELIEKRILAPQTFFNYRYDFKNGSIFDFYLKNHDGRIYSRGFSSDVNEAAAKALGEVFERQFTESHAKDSEIVYASLHEMRRKKYDFVDPLLYPQPTQKQVEHFPDVFKYDDNTVFAWVQAKKISNGEEVYILGQDAHWAFSYFKAEPRMVNQGTNGCGGGYTYGQALDSALFELIQRDTFFRFWYEKRTPQHIDIATIPRETKTSMFIENLEADSFEVYLLDMTDEAGIPTVTAVIKRPYSGWFLGASSSLSKEKAAYRALEEAFSIYMWTFQQAKNGTYDVQKFIDEEVAGDFLDERVTGRERCLLWGSEFYLEQQDQFLIKGEKIPFKESEIDKDFNLVNFLTQKFGEGYVIQAKNSSLDEYGYFSLKVSFPSMYTLILIERHARPVLNGIYPQNLSSHPFP